MSGVRTKVTRLVVFLLGAGVLVAPAALASFGVVVQVPATSFYSPYNGPATVRFTFDGADPASVFTVRLRRPGHGTVTEKDYLVDPATDGSPHTVKFSWYRLSVSAPTDFVVDVRPQAGGGVISQTTFTLLPKLISDLSAKPSPFYPLVQDGYKDRTKIRFSLAADTAETAVQVFREDAYGRCCSAEVRTQDLGPLASGAHGWSWDGRKQDGSLVSKGTFFARITATDTHGASTRSKALAVDVTKGVIRMTATKHKPGSAYSKVADEQETAIGGDCGVSKNLETHSAGVLCANANISVYWHWALGSGERIEGVSFKISGGYYGCHHHVDHTADESILRVYTPPTSTCTIFTARIKYSYPVQV